MPIGRAERLNGGSANEIGIRLHGCGSNLIVRLFYADVPGPASWNASRLTRFESLFQDQIDVRIPINDPSLSEDPAGSIDPARPDFFYEGGDLVSRSVIISNASWDGSRMSFTLTRARKT